jgi:hypothetical protein
MRHAENSIVYSAVFNDIALDHSQELELRGYASPMEPTNIGNEIEGVAGESNACYIGSIFNQLASGGTQVFVNTNGKLGTTPSSRRFKDDVRPMDDASDTILALKPVTFHYKKDPNAIPQFGLVAEDVEAIDPDLVVRDKEGQANSVRYEAVNAMLLNEFLKEHRKVQEQETAITQLKKDFDSTIAQFTARLHEQAEQIQKVNAQLEANKPAPQVVNNPSRQTGQRGSKFAPSKQMVSF